MGHHDVLGVATNATPEQIKAAYRKKAKEFHPDRNPGDADAARRFCEVQDAYDALTDPNYRQPRHRPSAAPTPTYSPPKPNPDSWIKDAPPPTHDIWGNPIGPNVPPPRPKPRPRPRPAPIAKIEPEVDLWAGMETKESKFNKRYWKEYNRLKHAMAYEEPDKFWEALDEWVRKNK
jgi:hypothetical protein